MSDILSRNVLKDKRCTEYILRIILNDKEVKVIDQKLQADYRNLHGRGAVLDCLVVDSRNRAINIELQQDNEGAHPKRMPWAKIFLSCISAEPSKKLERSSAINLTLSMWMPASRMEKLKIKKKWHKA